MANDIEVYVTTREEGKAHHITELGGKPVIFKPSELIKSKVIENADFILSTVPPIGREDVVIPILKESSLNNNKWICYLSSTGVYGDYQGGLVNEDSELLGNDLRSLNRISAEQKWMHSFNANIFRLSGIYGDDKNVAIDLKNGNARIIYKPNHYFSRIHVEDIAGAVISSINKRCSGEVYNISDDMPAPSHEVALYAATKMGITPPKLHKYEEIKDSLSDMMRSFYSANKKINNSKMKSKLLPKMQHPSYIEFYSSYRA